MRSTFGVAALALLIGLGYGCTAVAPTGSNNGGNVDEGPTAPKIITVAGTGFPGNNGDGHDALETQFYYPVDMEFSPAGQLHVVDWNNHRIRRLNADNTFETLVGTGELTGDLQEEGIAKEAKLNHPTNIFFEPNGDMLIAAWHNSQVTRTTLSVEGTATVMNNVVAGKGGREFCCDGQPAKDAKFNLPSSIVEDSFGNIIVADQANQRIRRIDAITTVVETICNDAGPDTPATGGFNGDDIRAVDAQIKLPAGQSSSPAGRLAIDQFDNLYLADTDNHRIRMIDNLGTITTVAGTGTHGFAGDGGPALEAQLDTPSDVWVSPDGSVLYVADTMNHAIRMVKDGILTTVAGVLGERPTDTDGDGFISSEEAGDGLDATKAHLDRPFGISVNKANGDIYIADTHNSRIRKVTTSVVSGPVDQTSGFEPVDVIPCDDDTIGSICTFAGIGEKGFNGDGLDRTQSTLYWPLDIEFTPSGKTYVIDWNNHKLREILGDGTLITRVGNEFIGDGPPDFSDLYPPPGALGTTVNLNHIGDLLEMPTGELIMTVWHNHKIRLYYPDTGIVEVALGDYPMFTDNVEAYNARVNLPAHSVLDSRGNLIIMDQKNWRFRVADNFVQEKALAFVHTIAGVGTHAVYVDGTPIHEATFGWPGGPNPEPNGGLVIDPNNDLLFYFVETESHSVFKMEFTDEQWSDGAITRIAGTGVEGFADGPGLTAQFNWPQDMEMGPDGNLYLADTNNFRTRKIDLTTGEVSTVAGTGEKGYDGDGGLAINAKFDRAFGIAFDHQGDLYISDTFNGRIRVVNLNLQAPSTETQ